MRVSALAHGCAVGLIAVVGGLAGAAAAQGTAIAAGATATWVGPLAGFYNSSCAMGKVYGPFAPGAALAKCEQLCASTPGCNAMSVGSGYGLPHVGCVLRTCPAQFLANPPLRSPGVNGYYCNASRAAGFCAPTPPWPSAMVVLRSVYADHMVLQHGAPVRLVGKVVAAASTGSTLGGLAVVVELDGLAVARGLTTASGELDVSIAAQPVSSTPHMLTVRVATNTSVRPAILPAILSDVVFGEQYLCSGPGLSEIGDRLSTAFRPRTQNTSSFI